MAMAGEVSAPKDRVMFKVAVSKDKGEEEVPFRIAVLDHFSGRDPDEPLSERKMICASDLSMDECVEAVKPSLEIRVKDVLSGNPDSYLPLSLSFNSMDAFGPAGVAKQVEPIQKLIELRELLDGFKTYMGRDRFLSALRQLLGDEQVYSELVKRIGVTGGSDA